MLKKAKVRIFTYFHLCRQKAHLQRHETTHGVGVKVNRGQNAAQRRKRKRSRGATNSGGSTGGQQSTSVTLSANLQQRLARVSEQFGTAAKSASDVEDEDDEDEDEELSVNHSGGAIKSYSKRKTSSDDKSDLEDNDEDMEDEDGHVTNESKTTVTIEATSNPEVFQSSYVDVQDEVTDLRDEDIIEAVPGTTVVMTCGVTAASSSTTVSTVDAVTAAVNEAIKDMEYEAAEVDNVRVEAQPEVPNMSPESLTAISGNSSPQPPASTTSEVNPEAKNQEMMPDLFQDEDK